MTDGVLITNTTLAFNKSEKESGQAPSKLRMTADTIDSFRENIASGKIAAATEKFNQEYQEIRQALIAAETEAAEQQVRATVINDGKTQAEIEKEKALEMAKIREDQMLSRLSSVDVVKPKLVRLNIEPGLPDTIFGRNEKGLVALSTPKLVPRALMVPGYFGKTYKKIGKNSSLYKLADSIIESKTQTPQEAIVATAPVAPPPPPKVANWRGLFDNSAPQQVVQPENPKKEAREEILPIPTEQRGITKEELAERKVKAQIGDELSQIRRLQKGIAGTAPFNIGLLERENALLQMLSQITGIKVDVKETPKEERNVTEFQRFIDSIIGYKKPLTEEEHQRKEREMEEHYTNPEVVETMRALQLKNILYDLNTPDSYERISEAERKDNELKAAQSTALEHLGNAAPNIKVEIANVEQAREEAKVPSQEPKVERKIPTIPKVEVAQPVVAGPTAEELEAKRTAELQSLRAGAKEQAKMLHSKAEREFFAQGAKEQAKMLYDQSEREFLSEGAKEQARLLHSNNQMVDLKNGAEEQARLLYANAKRNSLSEGAMEQARMLYAQAEREFLAQGAEEQARLIYAKEERQFLSEGAKEQARMLYAQAERALLAEGAKEQARLLHSSNQMADLRNGAEEQARFLFERNKQAQIEEEQLRQQEALLQAQRQQAQAQVQAQIQTPMPAPVEAQPEPTPQPALEIKPAPKLESLNLELTDLNYRYGSIVSPSKPIKVNQIQISRFRKAKKAVPVENTANNTDVKDMLVSLKEQLEELGLGTAQESYQDSYQDSYSLAA